MMNVAARQSQWYRISNIFRQAAAAGLTVSRTWAFSDGVDQALQVSPWVFSGPVFSGIMLLLFLSPKLSFDT
jgi:mannan endo-1,4-beta-mannosidase